MRINKIFIILPLFFISRIVFITTAPIFFDSQEYLDRLANPNYFSAIISGHNPIHAGFPIIFWPVFQFSEKINLNPVFWVILAQIILSMVAVLCFYKATRELSNERIAFFTSLISIFTPLFWITNVTIMMESTYISFFLFSFYFLVKFLKHPKYKFLFLSSLFFGFSFLTHPFVILWMPFLTVISLILNRKKVLHMIVLFGASAFIFAMINIYLSAQSIQSSFSDGARLYLFSKIGEHAILSFSLNSLFIALRNTIIPLLRNDTSLLVFIAGISLINFAFYKKKLFWIGLFWILPSVEVNQWWDSLLFGRHSAIAGFGLAFLAGIFFEKRRFLKYLLLLYVISVSLPALMLLKSDAPYLKERKTISSLPSGFLISGNFERPQIYGLYKGENVFVNEPEGDRQSLEEKIDKYLTDNKNVFISSQALSDPYGLYTGPYLHNLSLSYAHDFTLSSVISKYKLTKYSSIDNEETIVIYKILKKESSPYPEIKKLNYSFRRIDYHDPVFQFWKFINSHQPKSQ